MKCLLKSKDLTFEVYWIKRAKNKIIGGFWGDYWNDIFGFPVEVHFTYPEDGQMHYSYKSEEKKVFVTAFHDEVKIKEKGNVHVLKQRILLNHLIPGPELLRPLADYTKTDIWFSFPTTGCPIPIPPQAINQKIYKKFSGISSPVDDLVVDVDHLAPGTSNISAFITSSSGHPSLGRFSENNHWNKVDEKSLPIVGLSVIHCLKQN